MSTSNMPKPGRSNLERLLRPQSVAIVGASDKPGSFGNSVHANLRVSKYAGDLHLVNPKRTEIDGHPCVASVDDLPFGVDCAVLAIPKAGVLEAVRACGRRGVGGVIIFSAGFAESGEQGVAEQAELTRIARDSGLVIEGPNCLGMVNAVDGIALTFVTTPPLEFRADKGVAIVSQSGAMAAVLGVTFRAHALDLTYSVSTGNEAVSGAEDYLEFLLSDAKTAVIAILAEQFRNPRRFLSLAQRARTMGKRIVLLHPGSSNAARASAATHTGAIAGDYEVMRTKVADAGVVLVETLEELADVAHLLLRCPMPPAGGAAVLTESGAFKALTLDLCERLGLPLPALSVETASALRRALPDFIPPSNPLDITAQGLVDPGLYQRTLPPLLSDAAFGSVVLTIILTDQPTGELKLPPILDALATCDRSKPIIFAGLDEGAWIDESYVKQLRTLQVPFFPTAERAFRALARLATMSSLSDIRSSEVEAPSVAERLPSGTITEYESKKLLQSAGIPVGTGELAETIDQAIDIAERLTYPVVLKAQSKDLSHKSDAGGVILNLRTREELLAGWARLNANLAKAAPGLQLDGVLVETMSAPGLELIVGARNDPDWGPVLLAGLGGVFAEALHDVRLLVPGLSIDAIVRELKQLRGAALLGPFRGAPAVDITAIAQLIQRLGQFVLAHPEILEVDINPVLAYPEGRGVMALDALILTR